MKTWNGRSNSPRQFTIYNSMSAYTVCQCDGVFLRAFVCARPRLVSGSCASRNGFADNGEAWPRSRSGMSMRKRDHGACATRLLPRHACTLYVRVRKRMQALKECVNRRRAGGGARREVVRDKGSGTSSASCTCRMSCGFLAPRRAEPRNGLSLGLYQRECFMIKKFELISYVEYIELHILHP
ncbi:LOW QUALITY PROTEIN: uncharacterized protein ACR2FA_007381 [Aphomia sociella]